LGFEKQEKREDELDERDLLGTVGHFIPGSGVGIGIPESTGGLALQQKEHADTAWYLHRFPRNNDSCERGEEAGGLARKGDTSFRFLAGEFFGSRGVRGFCSKGDQERLIFNGQGNPTQSIRSREGRWPQAGTAPTLLK